MGPFWSMHQHKQYGGPKRFSVTGEHGEILARWSVGLLGEAFPVVFAPMVCDWMLALLRRPEPVVARIGPAPWSPPEPEVSDVPIWADSFRVDRPCVGGFHNPYAGAALRLERPMELEERSAARSAGELESLPASTSSPVDPYERSR